MSWTHASYLEGVTSPTSAEGWLNKGMEARPDVLSRAIRFGAVGRVNTGGSPFACGNTRSSRLGGGFEMIPEAKGARQLMSLAL